MKNNNIIEINEGEFNDKVIEASTNKLILVDFWAPWCGPCKQLTPLLEKIISKADDKVTLVKINIDENQQIASQLRIQSIPAVFAFKDGQASDAFQGVIPENKIIEFIEKSLGEPLIKDHTSFYESVNILLNQDQYNEALDSLEVFISNNPDEFKAFSLYIDCLINLEKFDEADEFYKTLSEDSINNPLIKSVYQKLKIKKKNSVGPSLESIKTKYQKNPESIKNILDLADKYFAENMLDEAFTLLLDNYLKHKEPIKNKILEYFAALGNENEKTIFYRRQFSSIIFS